MKSITNNDVFILHFPYRFKTDYKDLMFDYAKNIKIQLPDNISLISPITADKVENSPLHLQCELSNVKYYNYDKINERKWKKELKPYYINEILQDITTDYCIILDGLDTVFCDDAREIINVFNTYNEDIIYNDNLSKSPKGCLLEDYKGLFHHINGGICIGTTASLKMIYGYIAKKVLHTEIHCEYGHLEIAMHNFEDLMTVDYNFKLFQIINVETFLKDNKATLAIEKRR